MYLNKDMPHVCIGLEWREQLGKAFCSRLKFDLLVLGYARSIVLRYLEGKRVKGKVNADGKLDFSMVYSRSFCRVVFICINQ